MKDDGKIVKVKAFPIAAKMTVGTQAVSGQILKLTSTGFLLEAPVPGLKTGAKFQIEFEIPITRHKIKEQCVLVKIYTTFEAHVLEGHFQGLGSDNEAKILKFLSHIPKTSRGEKV